MDKVFNGSALQLDPQLVLTIFDHMLDAIFIHRMDGKIIYVNQTMLRMYRIPTLEEALSYNIPEHYSAEGNAFEEVGHKFEQADENEMVFFPWKAKRPRDGSIFEVEVFLRKFRNAAGEVLAFAQVHDVTERKEVERLLMLEKQRTEDAFRRLQDAQEELRRLATTDALTGLANRRAILLTMDRELNRALRHGRPLSCLMLDIDLFKTINDRYGHLEGDRVIRAVANVLQQETRDADMAGRIGGEEFVMLLPETELNAATATAERLRQAVEAVELPVAGESIRFTVSIGVSALEEEKATLEWLLQRSDRALYTAKNAGRNRVCRA